MDTHRISDSEKVCHLFLIAHKDGKESTVTDKTSKFENANRIQPATFPTNGYVRLKQILAPDGPLPISKSGFWAGVKSGKFPQPRKISARVTAWRAEDIHSLLTKIEQGEV
jgi:prophage regulatory protein